MRERSSIARAALEVSERGGHLDLRRFRPKQSECLRRGIAIIADELNSWRGGRNLLWINIGTVFANKRSADAFVTLDDYRHTVGFNAGLILALRRVIDVVGNNPMVSEPLGLTAQADRGDVSELSTLSLIERSALRWVVCHEMAHILRGHLFFRRKLNLRPALCEASRHPPQVGLFEMVRFCENDADAVAADILMNLSATGDVRSQPENARQQCVSRAIFAAGIALMVLDRKEARYAIYERRANPHPFVRLLLAVDFAGPSALQHLSLTEAGMVSATLKAFQWIGMAAHVLGFRGERWLFRTKAAYEDALRSQQREISRYKALKAKIYGDKSTLLPREFFNDETTD